MAAEEAQLYQVANKAADFACETVERRAVASMNMRAAIKSKGKAIKAYQVAANLSQYIDLQKTVEQENADVAQRDAEHADLATASSIEKLRSTRKTTEDVFLLFKGNVVKDEDQYPNVRERMMKRYTDHFFVCGCGPRHPWYW